MSMIHFSGCSAVNGGDGDCTCRRRSSSSPDHPERGQGDGPLTPYVTTMVNLNTRMAEVVRTRTHE